MGDFTTVNDIFMTQSQKEYADSVNGKTIKVTKYYEAGMTDPSSIVYGYKEIGARNGGADTVLNVLETRELETGPVISLQKTWKEVGVNLVAHIENYEVDLNNPISIQLAWKELTGGNLVTFIDTLSITLKLLLVILRTDEAERTTELEP